MQLSPVQGRSADTLLRPYLEYIANLFGVHPYNFTNSELRDLIHNRITAIVYDGEDIPTNVRTIPLPAERKWNQDVVTSEVKNNLVEILNSIDNSIKINANSTPDDIFDTILDQLYDYGLEVPESEPISPPITIPMPKLGPVSLVSVPTLRPTQGALPALPTSPTLTLPRPEAAPRLPTLGPLPSLKTQIPVSQPIKPLSQRPVSPPRVPKLPAVPVIPITQLPRSPALPQIPNIRRQGSPRSIDRTVRTINALTPLVLENLDEIARRLDVPIETLLSVFKPK